MAETPAAETWNFADLWESIWPEVADREALVCGPHRITYGALAERANRLAQHLRSVGVGPGDRVGLFLRNDIAYLEAMLATFSLRAIPANMNFRYTGRELAHLLTDSGSKVLLVHRGLTAAVAGAPGGLDQLEHILVLDDPVPDAGDPAPVDLPNAVGYEEALAAASPERVETPGRGGDDEYLMYTGGTTGMPKGVRWRQEDAFFVCIGGGDPMRMHGPVSTPAELQDRIVPAFSYCPIAPLMHAAAQWTTFSWLLCGGKTVLPVGSLDGEVVWQTVQDEGVNTITVIGDAVGRPVIAAWEANPSRWDISSLFAFSNGGAPMSASLKDRIAELFPNLVITDGFGSSESGHQGSERYVSGERRGGSVARFEAGANTGVLDDDLRPVEPGSGVIGRVVRSGRLPIGYLNDPEKTAATFIEVDGVRHCFTGDMATVADDGSIALLGRGSQCINTGGEKVFPEEVETTLVDHPAVDDLLVVGTPDERWGSAVTAVVAPVEGAAVPTLEELREFGRANLAGYKLPRKLVIVEEIQRSPAGKADYRWAKATAEAADA